MDTVGDRIKYLRKKEGLNQIDFCTKINLSQGRLSEIEKGKNNPSYETLQSIKSIFRVSLDWLVSGEYPKTDNSTIQDNEPKVNLSDEEIHFIELLKKLNDHEKAKIEGMLELKVAEAQTVKKEKSSFYQNGDEDAAAEEKLA